MLGPGLLESVYEAALSYKLRKVNLEVKNQVVVPVKYENIILESGFRLDLLVNDKVIIELKSVEILSELHHKQLLTYLRLSDKKLRLLINFNALSLTNSIIRIVNNL